jgi:hypothetical protein
MELLWANKNFKYLGLAPHLNIAVLEMIMSYDDDNYDKLTCVWDMNLLFDLALHWNDILLAKLFRPILRKNCSSDREKLLKFEAEVENLQKKKLGSLDKLVQTVKDQNNFW